MKHYLKDLDRITYRLSDVLSLAGEAGLRRDEIDKLDRDLTLGEMLSEHARKGHWKYTPAIEAYIARLA